MLTSVAGHDLATNWFPDQPGVLFVLLVNVSQVNYFLGVRFHHEFQHFQPDFIGTHLLISVIFEILILVLLTIFILKFWQDIIPYQHVEQHNLKPIIIREALLGVQLLQIVKTPLLEHPAYL